MSNLHTTIYRAGNTSSGKFDNLRDKDIPVVDGKVHPNTGGISTFSQRDPAWGANKTWVLEHGTNLGSELIARNDRDALTTLERSNKAVRFDRVPHQPGAFALELPAQCDHASEHVRVVYEGLAAVARNKIRIEDWDENDYTHIGIIAHCLHHGVKELAYFTYKPGEHLHKHHALVAEAVLAHIGHRDVECRKEAHEEKKAKWVKHRAILRLATSCEPVGGLQWCII
ncbi:hypothetical protein ABKN59_010342 [Abortiporus biennis]